MSVNAPLTYSVFVPDTIRHFDVTSGLWIIGRFYGKNQATGDGTGGGVNGSVCPLPALPKPLYLPKLEAYFSLRSICMTASTNPGNGSAIVYSDEYIGSANMRYQADTQGTPGLNSEGLYDYERAVPPGCNIGLRIEGGLGSIKMGFQTNTNGTAYNFYAGGLILETEEWLNTFIQNWKASAHY